MPMVTPFAACVALAGLVLAGAAMAADTTANAGALSYAGAMTYGDGKGAALRFDLKIKGGAITGTVTADPSSGLEITGPITAESYWENSRCMVVVPGPAAGVTYEFAGKCTTTEYSGYLTTHGPNRFSKSGEFKAAGANAAAAPAKLATPTGKLTCAYQRHTGTGQYELSFSAMGAITLQPGGTYVTGTGKTGRWVRDGDSVRLVGGVWNNRMATIEADRTGKPKLVFRSIDPGITNCTSGR